jgi:uncharacterized protein (TIGR03437 family)
MVSRFCPTHRSSAVLLFVASLLFGAVAARAQVKVDAAVNAASFINSALPNGKLAQGVLFTAFGSNMGPASIVRVSEFPLPTTLGGTSVRVTVGGTQVNCLMIYTIAGQIAAILPNNTPVGNGTLTVTYNGQTSAPLNIQVVPHSFGIFSVNLSGTGPAVMTDPFTAAANSFLNAANPQKLLDIWGTGLSAVNADESIGPAPGDLPNLNVEVWVGGKQAEVLYRGRSGCCSGVDQIRISVPAGVFGCSVPLYVVVQGVPSNFMTMSIAPSGSACSEPGGVTPGILETLQTNGSLRIGSLGLGRLLVLSQQLNYRSDVMFAGFVRISAQSVLQNSATTATSGSCTVMPIPSGLTAEIPVGMAAGQISVASPMGNYPLSLAAPGNYLQVFSPSPFPIPGIITDGTVLTTGNYTFTGTGGAEVGAFSASMNLPNPIDWPAKNSITLVNRSQPLTITWTGGTPGATVAVTGRSTAAPDGKYGASFLCWADATAGNLTVPVAVLSALPPSFLQSNNHSGSLNVTQQFLAGPFNVSGIDVTSASHTDGFNKAGIQYQ